jgi:hypothetical protein
MSLNVGIVGLPNVGKSTLFNALLKKQQAYVANFPFATIEPNIGIVPVPDNRLTKLADVVKSSENMSSLPPEVPATVQFMDIAGLIKGASQGEGLGNKFLSHIREVNAICHVVRLFSDPEIIKQGVTDPKTDFEVVETELKLADYQTLEKQKDPGNTPNPELKKWWATVMKLKDSLQKGIPVREIVLSEDDKVYAKQLSLLTAKPILVALNVDEADLKNAEQIETDFAKENGLDKDQVVAISAKVESELSELTNDEQRQYLKELGVEKSGLERLIQKAFSTLGLITFLTAGVKEVRAWTIKDGINAQNASGEIHTDFIKNFIKADVVSFDDFINNSGLASPKQNGGGWKWARDNGKVRSEGRDYIMKDGEVVEFKIGA